MQIDGSTTALDNTGSPRPMYCLKRLQQKKPSTLLLDAFWVFQESSELVFQIVRIPEPGNRGGLPDSQQSIARTDEPAQSSFTGRSSYLGGGYVCDFAVRPTDLEPNVGRLGAAGFGTTCALAISSFSRARASARLASCVRCTRVRDDHTPSCVARLAGNARGAAVRRGKRARSADIEAQLERQWRLVDVRPQDRKREQRSL